MKKSLFLSIIFVTSLVVFMACQGTPEAAGGTGGGASGRDFSSVSATRLDVGMDWYIGTMVGPKGTTRYFRVQLLENSLYIISWYDMDYFPGMGAWGDIEVGLINQTTGVFVQDFINHTTERNNGFIYIVPQGGTGYYLVAVRLRTDEDEWGSFHLRVQG